MAEAAAVSTADCGAGGAGSDGGAFIYRCGRVGREEFLNGEMTVKTMKPAIDGMKRLGMSASDIIWKQVELLKAGKDLPLLDPSVQLNGPLPASLVHAVIGEDVERGTAMVPVDVAPGELPERYRKGVRAVRERTRKHAPLRDLPRWGSAEFWERAAPRVKAAADKWCFVATIGYVNRSRPFVRRGAYGCRVGESPHESRPRKADDALARTPPKRHYGRCCRRFLAHSMKPKGYRILFRRVG